MFEFFFKTFVICYGVFNAIPIKSNRFFCFLKQKSFNQISTGFSNINTFILSVFNKDNGVSGIKNVTTKNNVGTLIKNQEHVVYEKYEQAMLDVKNPTFNDNVTM